MKETFKRMGFIFLDHILVGGGLAVGAAVVGAIVYAIVQFA